MFFILCSDVRADVQNDSTYETPRTDIESRPTTDETPQPDIELGSTIDDQDPTNHIYMGEYYYTNLCFYIPITIKGTKRAVFVGKRIHSM